MTVSTADSLSAAATSIISKSSACPIFANDSTVIFIYKGAADSVQVAGDWSGWRPLPLAFDSMSGVWFRRERLHPEARVDYKFILNQSEWILDPGNPRTSEGGFGPNSELAMPRYLPPAEITPLPADATGMVVDVPFFSRVLNQQRIVQIYFPPDYSADNAPLPLVLFLDGSEFLRLASAPTILDYLIQEKQIEPLVAVFDSPADRMVEYGGKPGGPFERYLADELLHLIAQSARVSPLPAERAIFGVSLSAAYATQFAYLHPDLFGCCAAFSPAYWYDQRRVYELLRQGDVQTVRFYLDRGTYEGASIAFADSMKQTLLEKGYDLRWNLWHEGHSWGNWRAHLDEALRFFFPWQKNDGSPRKMLER
jgi:enterochelin esterase-like enzyme